jgi:hypothetical protein
MLTPYRRINVPVKDFQTLDLLNKVSLSFNTLMNARFIRTAYEGMELPHGTRGIIDSITQENAYYRANGYLFTELYTAVLAMAEFVYKCRTELLPNIKFFLTGAKINESDRLREEMAADNFKANLDVLADQVNALYLHVVQIDKESHTVKPPVYRRIPELSRLGQLLTESVKGLIR